MKAVAERPTLGMVAFDLGAESGRAVLGRFDGRRLTVEEVHRFPNEPVQAAGHLYWDFLRLFAEMKRGLGAARRAHGAALGAIGVDAWGVDFALFTADGELVANPYHYRDPHTKGMMERAFSILPARELFQITGIQMMPINTLFQLLALKTANSPLLRAASTLLMMPSAFSYLLSGEPVDEFTAVSTSQLYNSRAGCWASPILNAFDLPERLFPTVRRPGTVVGALRQEHAHELGMEPTPVVLPAGHDTACAVAAVPASPSSPGRTRAYISSGTWSLVGVERQQPITTEKAFAANLSNEGGVFGTFRLLKNVMGLWLLQQCQRQWQREGFDATYSELTRMASGARGRQCFIDPDDESFLRPTNVVESIQRFCRQTGQRVPEDRAEIVRTILKSLALKYRWVIEQIQEVTGSFVDRIHVVGGGARNELLCQLTADVTGRPVIAGPVEATAVGNLLMQAKALGEITTLEELRSVVRESFATTLYEPGRTADWEDTYQYFQNRILNWSGSERETASPL
ncbi:MAG: rhamnulokinase family protein [Bacillota bacterium]